jgi:5-formyltetrahydrofolate cyclo-ligase
MAETSSELGSDWASFRAAWRREKLTVREALSEREHALASAAIDAHLTSLIALRPPRTVAFCWPVRKEFDCRPLVDRLLAAGWQACQPVVVAKEAPMVFRAWRPGAAMTTDCFGIPVPADAAAAVPDIVLLPLVAFDEQGYRLGYGGGFFDRTLARMAPRPVTIGVGFELGRLESLQPQAHDVPLDAIVTERRVRQYGGVT